MDLEKLFPQEYNGHFVRSHMKTLIISSSDYQKHASFYNLEGYNEIEINPNYHSPTNLDFLQYFNDIKGMTILTTNLRDVEGLYSHINLEKLIIDHIQKVRIDFNRFSKLNTCMIPWGTPGSEFIFDCQTLINLRINNFSSTEIWQIANCQNIKKLELPDSSLVNINSIGSLYQLNILDLNGGRKLENIDQLCELAYLETLNLSYCKNINSLTSVGQCKSLKNLYMDDIGTIESIDFIDDLDQLELIRFVNTKVVKGNLEVLFSKYKNGILKEVYFKNSRNYSRKVEEFGYKPHPLFT